MAVLTTMLRNENPSKIEFESAVKKVIDMIAMAEETYSFMANDKNQGKTFAIAGYRAQEYSSKIRKNWNNVRELLLPFAINPELLPQPFVD